MAKGGGVQEYVRALRKSLAERGHDARIITPRPRGEFDEEQYVSYLGAGADLKTPLGTTAQLSIQAKETDIDALLEEEQFDVLHFHEPWVPMLGRQLAAKSQALGVVNIATFHAKLPDTMMAQTLSKVVSPYTKSIIKYFTALTAVSSAAAEYITALTDREITIIPNGVDLTAYKSPKKRPTNKLKTVLYIGRLEPRKGAKHLLRAFALLQAKQPDTQLLIAGNGEMREELELLAAKLSLQHVTFLGFISDEQKHELLESADVFCSPALYGESFGIVLIEAMASGAPTVAGDNPGYKTVLTGTGALGLVDPKDHAAFAERLEQFLYNEDIRSIWQKWAKDEIGQYDYPVITKKFEVLYKTVCEHHDD